MIFRSEDSRGIAPEEGVEEGLISYLFSLFVHEADGIVFRDLRHNQQAKSSAKV